MQNVEGMMFAEQRREELATVLKEKMLRDEFKLPYDRDLINKLRRTLRVDQNRKNKAHASGRKPRRPVLGHRPSGIRLCEWGQAEPNGGEDLLGCLCEWVGYELYAGGV